MECNFRHIFDSFGLQRLEKIHLIRCLNISNVEWLECLGKQETLQDLCIKNCRGIGEG
ncbi:hypothetical protein HanPI659440_Chr04g0163721 [Helianthus annuus]|nr:hypothetical protein HanPI659440_Chr04g0163721 [Helianthus annuus]